GDPSLYRGIADRLGLTLNVAEIDKPADASACFADALPVLPLTLAEAARPGTLSPANAEAVIEAIDRAAQLCLSGEAGGMVTNPIHKRALYDAGLSVPGHTEYLAALCGGITPVMMLSCP